MSPPKCHFTLVLCRTVMWNLRKRQMSQGEMGNGPQTARLKQCRLAKALPHKSSARQGQLGRAFGEGNFGRHISIVPFFHSS